MAFTKIVGAGIHTLSNVHTHNINSSGIITATQFVGIFTGTNGNFSGNLDVGGNVSIGGSLTVNGDFTTLNTTLREVEILNVDANSSESAGIITQRGSGDILNLFDTNTEVFTVKDGGRVGIKSDSPITTLDVGGGALFKTNGAAVKIESSPGTNFTQLQLVNSGGSFYVGRENSAGNWFQSGTGYASVLRSDGAYPLIFRVNSDNSMIIDSSGRVLIGTATEGQATADDLTIATSGTTGITIRSGTGNDGNIYFSDGTSGSDEFRGYVQYGHSNNSMVFGTNSIERLRILSDGKTGIGTNNPGGLLTVYGSPAELRLQHDGNGSFSKLISDSNNQLNIYTGGGPHLAMTIDGSQNVGIDLASPDTTYKLDVGGAGQFTTSSTNQSNDFLTGQLTVRNSQNAQGAFIDFRAKTNTGIQGVIAKIGGFNAYSGSGYDGLLTFSTRQNSNNTMVERMRINSSGEISIGTASGGKTLTLYGASSSSFRISKSGVLAYDHTFDGSTYEIKNNNGSAGIPIIIGTKTAGGESLRITSAGDVGIGYDSPTVKLHVREGASGASSYDNRYHIICENNGEAYLGFYVPNNMYAGIRFSDTTGLEGYIDYYFGTDEFVYASTSDHYFKTGGQERLRIDSNGTVHTKMTGTAPSWLGNTMACREKFSVFQGANFGEACFNIDVDNANSFLSHNMYYDGGWKIKKSGSPVRHLQIGTDGWKFYTGADGSDNTGSSLTERFRISPTGRIIQGTNNENIDMDSNSSGQLTLDGNGYTFGIAMGSNHTALYHNSSSRDLVLGTDETERFRVGVGFGQLSDNTAAYYKPNLYIKNTSHNGYGGAITFTGEDGSGNEYTQARIRTYGGSGSGDGSVAIEAGDLNEVARFKSGKMSIGGREPNIYGAKGLEISNGATTEIRLKNNNGGNGQGDGLAIQKWTSDVSYVYEYDQSDLIFGVSNQSKLRLFKQGRLCLSPSGNTTGGNSQFALSIVQDGNYAFNGSGTSNYPGIHIKSTSSGGGNGAAIYAPDSAWSLVSNNPGNKTGLAMAPSSTGANSAQARLFLMEDGQCIVGANTYSRVNQARFNAAQLTVAGGGINVVPITSGTSSPQVRHTVSWYHAGPNSSYSYQHLVTDVWGGGSPAGNTEYIMGGFTIKGYRYSPGGCSNEDIFFHNWGGSMHGYSRSHRGTWDPGNAAYIHSTGYVALRLLTGTYQVYDIDLYQFAVYSTRDFNVTTVTYSNNTTE